MTRVLALPRVSDNVIDVADGASGVVVDLEYDQHDILTRVVVDVPHWRGITCPTRRWCFPEELTAAQGLNLHPA